MPGEINVAYNGTSADLSGGDATLFDSMWNDFTSSSEDLSDLSAVANFTAINNTTGSNGTISPKDLFNDHTSSLPPSAAFTNLTTPGSAMLDTPDETYETSPLLDDNFGTTLGTNDQWFSLFPDAANDKHSPLAAPVMSRTTSSNSGKHVLVHPGGESRKRNSSNASPLTAFARPSSVAGIHKREKVLPPIVADENDSVALKRARNTAAARKSRDKKVKERDNLENRIMDLEKEVAHWKALALAGIADSA